MIGVPIASLAGVAIGIVLVPLTILTLVIWVQVMMALKPFNVTAAAASIQGRRPRLAILMPAHNEAAGITPAIRAAQAQLQAGDRLVVIADNCSDNTAAVARSLGAEVVERSHASLRGKGYALDFGVRSLEKDPPEVVVIVDADCLLAPDALSRLVITCARHGRATQALYLMSSPAGASLKTRVSEFAWLLKNQIRPLGFMRLGLPCQLMGSGMAFPWATIVSAPLASGHIVEDLQLGLNLATVGQPPMFCPAALVTSVFPSSEEALTTQRTRWEHGHLDIVMSIGPRALWGALTHRQARLGAMVLDMCVPPLSSLVLVLVAAVAVTAGVALTGLVWPLWLASFACAAMATAVLLAWFRYGQRILHGRELLSIPVYVLSKIPLYLRAITRRQVEWVRTERDESSKQ